MSGKQGGVEQRRLSIERANTVLYCRRWTETVAFYGAVLELPVEMSNDWFVEFRLTSSSFLSIADASRASVGSVDGNGVTLTWRVADAAVVREHLVVNGIDATPIRRRWGADGFFCRDPEGNRVEIWTAPT